MAVVLRDDSCGVQNGLRSGPKDDAVGQRVGESIQEQETGDMFSGLWNVCAVGKFRPDFSGIDLPVKLMDANGTGRLDNGLKDNAVGGKQGVRFQPVFGRIPEMRQVGLDRNRFGIGRFKINAVFGAGSKEEGRKKKNDEFHFSSTTKKRMVSEESRRP